jgi:D-sedoheptulose 7-phosphate isomerase
MLYPMLSEQPSAPPEVLEALARAPREKAREANRLRQEVLAEYEAGLARCSREMAERFRRGGKLLACGNGGSATAAADLATEFLSPGPSGLPLPALSLTNDIAIVTAIANDISFQDIFLRQLVAFAGPDDIMMGISTSGNSENILRAMREAQRRGLLTFGLAGYDGGRMATETALDYCFLVRSSSVHRIQEVQTTIYHALWALVQQFLEGDYGLEESLPASPQNVHGESVEP